MAHPGDAVATVRYCEMTARSGPVMWAEEGQAILGFRECPSPGIGDIHWDVWEFFRSAFVLECVDGEVRAEADVDAPKKCRPRDHFRVCGSIRRRCPD